MAFLENKLKNLILHNNIECCFCEQSSSDANIWRYYQLREKHELPKELQNSKELLAVGQYYITGETLLRKVLQGDNNALAIMSDERYWFAIEVNLKDYTRPEKILLLKHDKGTHFTDSYLKKFEKFRLKLFNKNVCDAIFNCFIKTEQNKYEKKRYTPQPGYFLNQQFNSCT